MKSAAINKLSGQAGCITQTNYSFHLIHLRFKFNSIPVSFQPIHLILIKDI